MDDDEPPFKPGQVIALQVIALQGFESTEPITRTVASCRPTGERGAWDVTFTDGLTFFGARRWPDRHVVAIERFKAALLAALLAAIEPICLPILRRLNARLTR